MELRGHSDFQETAILVWMSITFSGSATGGDQLFRHTSPFDTYGKPASQLFHAVENWITDKEPHCMDAGTRKNDFKIDHRSQIAARLRYEPYHSLTLRKDKI